MECNAVSFRERLLWLTRQDKSVSTSFHRFGWNSLSLNVIVTAIAWHIIHQPSESGHFSIKFSPRMTILFQWHTRRTNKQTEKKNSRHLVIDMWRIVFLFIEIDSTPTGHRLSEWRGKILNYFTSNFTFSIPLASPLYVSVGTATNKTLCDGSAVCMTATSYMETSPVQFITHNNAFSFVCDKSGNNCLDTHKNSRNKLFSNFISNSDRLNWSVCVCVIR